MNLNFAHRSLGALVLALTATLGSLFFSEVMLLPPCVLCWYQRIAMYPLVFLFAQSFLQQQPAGLEFAKPLVLAGWLVALYHNLLYYHVIPESITPCAQGVSCTSVQLQWLGFITIPLLSLSAFTLLGLILFFSRSRA